MSINLVSTPTAEPLHRDEVKDHIREDGSDQNTLIEHLISAARAYVEGFTRRSLLTRIYDLRLDGFPDEIRLPRPPVQAVSSVTYTDSDGDSQTLAATEYTVDQFEEPARIVEAYNKVWPTTRDHINVVTVRFVAGYATPFTVATSTDILTATNHQFANGDVLQLSNSGGHLPAGLAVDTDYYAVSVSGDTLKLEASVGGGAIDITDGGKGTHFLGVVPERFKQAMLLLIAHWYENRESVIKGTISKEAEFAVSNLLASDRVYPEVVTL